MSFIAPCIEPTQRGTLEMPQADNKIIRTIAVPSWMVWGGTALICVLSGGPVGQLVMVSHHVYTLQERLADTERKVAADGVKQDDIVHALQDVRKEVHELNRSVAILNTKVP